jgi:hypothetical protein
LKGAGEFFLYIVSHCLLHARSCALCGGQPEGFTVTGRNTGPVAVVVLAKGEAVTVVMGRIEPGASVDAAFGAGEQALLRNTSGSRMARMKLVVRGDTSSLGMTYSANPGAR